MSYRRKHINPKIRSLRPRKRFWKRPLFWIVLGIFLIATLAYFVLFYKTFQVKNIEISGNEKIKSEEIQNIVSTKLGRKILFTSSKSIFIVDTNNAVKSLLRDFPEIETVDIQKKFPDSMTVTVKERQPIAVFCQTADNCFFIDRNGVVFEKTNTGANMMIITEEQTDGNVFAGENIVDKNIMDGIAKIQKNLKNNFQIDIQKTLVSNLLIFTTSENWKIYFDPTIDIDPQIIKMNALLKDQITPEVRKNLQYIYLQYKDRAYYK